MICEVEVEVETFYDKNLFEINNLIQNYNNRQKSNYLPKTFLWEICLSAGKCCYLAKSQILRGRIQREQIFSLDWTLVRLTSLNLKQVPAKYPVSMKKRFPAETSRFREKNELLNSSQSRSQCLRVIQGPKVNASHRPDQPCTTLSSPQQ